MSAIDNAAIMAADADRVRLPFREWRETLLGAAMAGNPGVVQLFLRIGPDKSQMDPKDVEPLLPLLPLLPLRSLLLKAALTLDDALSNAVSESQGLSGTSLPHEACIQHLIDAGAQMSGAGRALASEADPVAAFDRFIDRYGIVAPTAMTWGGETFPNPARGTLLSGAASCMNISAAPSTIELAFVRLLTAGADPNELGGIAIVRAVAAGVTTEMFDLLIDRGADCRLCQRDLEEIFDRQSCHLIPKAIAAGFDPTAGGSRLLARAACNGSAETVKAMLAAGCDPNAEQGWPLTCAVAIGSLANAHVLLAAGASPLLKPLDKDATAKSALEYARGKGNTPVELLALLESAAAQQLLRQRAPTCPQERPNKPAPSAGARL